MLSPIHLKVLPPAAQLVTHQVNYNPKWNTTSKVQWNNTQAWSGFFPPAQVAKMVGWEWSNQVLERPQHMSGGLQIVKIYSSYSSPASLNLQDTDMAIMVKYYNGKVLLPQCHILKSIAGGTANFSFSQFPSWELLANQIAKAAILHMLTSD